MKNGIVVTDIHKRFGETIALNGVSFKAYPGEVHAIVGENGSGKSTCAKILSGVLSADSGKVTIFGETPTNPIEARKIGIATIFQEILVAEDASIVDNLFVGSHGFWRKKVSVSTAYQLAKDIMRKCTGTDIDPDSLVSAHPISVKQWIVIARAFLTEPKVLILDESSAALDLDATARLHEMIIALRAKGSIIIIVTHRIAELIRITDRATVLRDGKVVGGLEKSEITEQNLLELMTPKKRVLKGAQTRKEMADQSSAKVVLAAKGLGVAKGARSVDFELHSGEIVGVSGLEGHGQNEWVRILAGLIKPSTGILTIPAKGGDINILSQAIADKSGIAYVSGDRKREGIFPNLSIYENLGIGLYPERKGLFGLIRSKEIDIAYDDEVKRLTIKTGNKNNKITSLSGGNQQKVLIGRAFSKNPKILVLNDPVRGVDLGTKRELYDELKRFTQSGGAVIYLSSEIEEFLGFADKVQVFHNGTIFRTLVGSEITEHAMLNGMFGHTDDVHFDFDDNSKAAV